MSMRELLTEPDAVSGALLWLSKYHIEFMDADEVERFFWKAEDLRKGPVQDIQDAHVKAIVDAYLGAFEDLATLSLVARLAQAAQKDPKALQKLLQLRDRVLKQEAKA